MAEVDDFIDKVLGPSAVGEKPRKEGDRTSLESFIQVEDDELPSFVDPSRPKIVVFFKEQHLRELEFDPHLPAGFSSYFHHSEPRSPWLFGKPTSPEPPTPREHKPDEAQELVDTLSKQLDPDELRELKQAVRDALDMGHAQAEAEPHPALEGLEDSRPLSRGERLQSVFVGLFSRFDLRLEQVGQSISASTAASHLKVSRDEVEQRRKCGELVAVKRSDGGWVYPGWQFDDVSDNRMLAGLSEVLPLLADLGPLETVAWLTRPKPTLDGRAPVDALRDGDVDGVRFLAGRVSGARG